MKIVVEGLIYSMDTKLGSLMIEMSQECKQWICDLPENENRVLVVHDDDDWYKNEKDYTEELGVPSNERNTMVQEEGKETFLRVKIYDTWHQPNDHICLVIEFDEQDKINIKGMAENCFKYAIFHDEDVRSTEEKFQWMEPQDGQHTEYHV